MTDILIIDDNEEISKLMKDFFQIEGFTCKICYSGEEGLEFLENNTVKLVLLDIMLPNMDGFQVCQRIQKQKNIPLIILSARNQKEDKLNGLYLGADDYIEKGCDIDILTAKVKALYRRNYDSAGEMIVCGDMKIDENRRTVCLKNKELNLTTKEYDLLLLLVENAGKVLRKEYIFDKVWGRDSFSEPSTLTVHIKWLREKIEENPKNPEKIITIWGVGYRFER